MEHERARPWPFAKRLIQRSIGEFLDDHCPQLAAAISYHVLFSLFPMLIVLGGIFGIVVNVTGIRADVVDSVVENAPLTEDGQARLERLLTGATGTLSALGLLALPGLVWAASGMMAALRLALALAFDVEKKRPFVRGKLVDLGLVFLVSLLFLLSFGLTIVARVVSGGAEDVLGRVGLGGGWISWLVGLAVPLVLAFLTTLFLYTVLPASNPTVADTWPAALFTASAFVALQNLFAVYVENFGNYNAIYGSLGAVIAFLFFIYLSANVFLLGAEIGAEWPRTREALRRGEEEEEAERKPLRQQVREIARGLVAYGNEQPPAEKRGGWRR